MKLYFVMWSNLNNMEAASRNDIFLKWEQIHLKIFDFLESIDRILREFGFNKEDSQ